MKGETVINITNDAHEKALREFYEKKFPELNTKHPERFGVMVYCPSGEVSFHYTDKWGGYEYSKDLLREACEKIDPNFPIEVWRVADIDTYRGHKRVGAYMNFKCQDAAQFEINDLAQLLSRSDRDSNKLRPLRGPIVLVLPYD